MIRQSCVSALFLGVLSGFASAGPVLLTSFSRQGGVVNASPTVRIGFVLEISNESIGDYALLGTDPMNSMPPVFLPNMFWSDGEEGILEFRESNDSGFAAFVASLTDELDDRLTLWSSWDTLVGDVQTRGGSYDSESSYFDPIDLVGADIEFIRLCVNEVSYSPSGLFGPEWNWIVTVEVLGTHPIPEPTTINLLCCAFLTCWFRMKFSRKSYRLANTKQ